MSARGDVHNVYSNGPSTDPCGTPKSRRWCSSNKRITEFWLSIAILMSLWKRRRAVSVLWNFLYADWNRSFKPFTSKYSISCTAKTFSTIFERNRGFEIGLKFWNSSVSRLSLLLSYYHRYSTLCCWIPSICPFSPHPPAFRRNCSDALHYACDGICGSKEARMCN